MTDSPLENQITLRRATFGDRQEMLGLICGLAQYENLPAPDEEAQQRLVEDAFGDRPRFEPWLAFVPESKGAVGVMVLFPTYSTFLAKPSIYIEDVFVLPELRNRGIGGALLKKAVELARQRGCGRVEWTALDWNAPARRVYEEKMGAKHMKEWLLYRMTEVEMDQFLDGGDGGV